MNLRTAILAAVIAALLQSTTATAQAAPPAAPSPAAQVAPVLGPHMTREEQIKSDWPWLSRFQQADRELGLPKAGEDRVVFMGDSITQGWPLEDSFPGKPYINRGISGQTSPQMLLRFRQDVIDLHPKVVVILAGTNDIAENTGPMTPEETENNLASMADLATANGIKVVLCSITPAFDFPWHRGLEPAQKIVALNQWIKSYAAHKGYVYVDYYDAMKDDRGGLPSTLSKDGVHPLPAGHVIMAPLAQKGIDEALAQ